ncbi:MAG TPA: DNA (cytosine-5-)-methyltransferase [Ktedonobacterales bacterium]
MEPERLGSNGPHPPATSPAGEGEPEQKTVAEFFAGIGLMRAGLERAGWRIQFANDIDASKFAMYRQRFPNANEHYVVGDIHRLDVSLLPRATLFTASFPCTDLSLAGGRGGVYHVESGAVWGFFRVIEGLASSRRPPLVLLENVPAFLTSNKGADFREVMLRLNGLGYAVDAFILDAAHFVPQSRQRLFVVGVREDLSLATLPEESELGVSEARSPALVAYMRSHPEIRWRVRPLPPLPMRATQLADILDDLPHNDPRWWSGERASYLLSQMSPRHRLLADAMIAQRKWSYGTAFRRMRLDKATGKARSMAELRVDGLAGCLRTPKGGSAKQILFKAGFGEYHARLLTPREAARLMGADDYPLPDSLDQALFGFGDAVVVPVVAWIAEYYLNPLLGELTRGRSARAALASMATA